MPNAMKIGYDKISKGYDELHGEEQLSKLNIIKNQIRPKPDAKLLDVGCGTGLSSNLDAKLKIGIDNNLNMLKSNNQLIKVCGGAEYLPFEDDTFDIVISLTAVHNFQDYSKAILEMKRVCNGLVIISLLKRSKNFEAIEASIKHTIPVFNEADHPHDRIFFCKV